MRDEFQARKWVSAEKEEEYQQYLLAVERFKAGKKPYKGYVPPQGLTHDEKEKCHIQ